MNKFGSTHEPTFKVIGLLVPEKMFFFKFLLICMGISAILVM